MKPTLTRWVPSGPLPARIAHQLRPLLAGATDPEWVLAELGRAWQQYRVDREILQEVLPRAERREYIRRLAALANELAQLVGEIPQEALMELRALLDDQYPTQGQLLAELERLQVVLLLLGVAEGRMQPLPAGRTTTSAEACLAAQVCAILTRVGITCTAHREGAFERVLAILLGKDPHRLAQRALSD